MIKTPVYIRTTMSDDGKTPRYEVMRDGMKIADISYVEMIELAMNITSALRFMPH